MTEQYNKWIKEETKMTSQEFKVKSVGKLNAQKQLQSTMDDCMNTNVMDCLGTMINSVVF